MNSKGTNTVKITFLFSDCIYLKFGAALSILQVGNGLDVLGLITDRTRNFYFLSSVPTG
jgi:hypothetical protein